MTVEQAKDLIEIIADMELFEETPAYREQKADGALIPDVSRERLVEDHEELERLIREARKILNRPPIPAQYISGITTISVLKVKWFWRITYDGKLLDDDTSYETANLVIAEAARRVCSDIKYAKDYKLERRYRLSPHLYRRARQLGACGVTFQTEWDAMLAEH